MTEREPWMTDPLYNPATGTPKEQLPTPALVVDVEVMEANLATMARFFENGPTRLRPHFKTHKCPILAQKQVQVGAIGLTCAKLSEAEVLAQAGIQSILIANEIVTPLKIARLAELSKQRQMIVAVDDAENIRLISQIAQEAGATVNLLVEVNVGLRRCGVQPGEPALVLARQITRLPGVHFSGLLGYEGHTVLIPDLPTRQVNVQQAMGELVRTADRIRQEGIAVEIVSAGGTGTYFLTGSFPGVTEVEAGSYLFMDTRYQQLGLPFRNSLSLVATVISVRGPSRAILDAGMKVLTTDNGLPEVISPPGVTLVALHEEHGILEVDATRVQLHLGDLVELLPSHVCTTVNLHDRYYALRNGHLEDIWPISGRGKSQ